MVTQLCQITTVTPGVLLSQPLTINTDGRERTECVRASGNLATIGGTRLSVYSLHAAHPCCPPLVHIIRRPMAARPMASAQTRQGQQPLHRLEQDRPATRHDQMTHAYQPKGPCARTKRPTRNDQESHAHRTPAPRDHARGRRILCHTWPLLHELGCCCTSPARQSAHHTWWKVWRNPQHHQGVSQLPTPAASARRSLAALAMSSHEATAASASSCCSCSLDASIWLSLSSNTFVWHMQASKRVLWCGCHACTCKHMAVCLLHMVAWLLHVCQ